jgi:N6-adenosine-specific RNA methylase IME4
MAVRDGVEVQLKTRKPLPYPAMTLDEIKALPVGEMAERGGCHLYLWTTNKYLRTAFDVLDAWGFRYGQTLVWAKTPMGINLGGAFAPTCEYVLTARRGSLKNLSRVDSVWFNWPRQGRGYHSQKPDAFMDLAEAISPAPRLEMFARRQRLGWDTWGNEALQHVDLQAATGTES